MMTNVVDDRQTDWHLQLSVCRDFFVIHAQICNIITMPTCLGVYEMGPSYRLHTKSIRTGSHCANLHLIKIAMWLCLSMFACKSYIIAIVGACGDNHDETIEKNIQPECSITGPDQWCFRLIWKASLYHLARSEQRKQTKPNSHSQKIVFALGWNCCGWEMLILLETSCCDKFGTQWTPPPPPPP